ncbi:MAG TPA: CBS domain-containing protein [Candidatus Binatia bacterium]|jgi:CBS domain-containing protein
MMARTNEWMVTNMVTATPFETVAEVARRMSSNNVGAVLVVQEGELWGLFSERDLVTRVVAQKRDPNATDVGQVATREVVTIDADAPMQTVLRVFRENKFRHLPVVQGGKPVGILSTRDFLGFLVQRCERCIDDVNYHRKLEEGVDPYDHPGGSYGR